MDLELKNKVALVMGASKGIGFGCAKELAKEGCHVIISSRNEANLKKAAIKIKSETKQDVEIISCDITNKKQIKNLINTIMNAHKKIDILINNTGGPKSGGFFDVNEEDWILAFEKTLLSTIRLYDHVLPIMKKNNFGRIINITSMSVKQPIAGLVLSNTIRPGIIGLAKTIADEVGKDNITINNIAPGHIDTERQEEWAKNWGSKSGKTVKEMYEQFKNNSVVGRVGTPEDIGSIVTFLSSPKSSFITGTTISVDGGRIRGLL